MGQDPKPQRYRCAHCGGEFVSRWTEAEAAAEVAAVFGVQHLASDAVLCEDCYRLVMAALSG